MVSKNRIRICNQNVDPDPRKRFGPLLKALFLLKMQLFYWVVLCLSVSDLFKLNQVSALHLLLYGEEQLPQYPGDLYLWTLTSSHTAQLIQKRFLCLPYHSLTWQVTKWCSFPGFDLIPTFSDNPRVCRWISRYKIK